MSDSQEVEVRDPGEPSPLDKMLEKYRDDFATLLPSHLPAAKFVRWSLGYLRQADKGLAAALQTSNGQISALVALMDAARLGLEPGVTYHLVPFAGIVTGIIDYKGDVELIARAGGTVFADTIYSKDDFDYSPPGDLIHKANRRASRGELEGAWAYATYQGQSSRIVVMFEPEMKAHEAAARGRDSLWQKDRDRAYLKSAVHELRKWVPWSAEWLPR